MTSEIDTALDNLQAIKTGKQPQSFKQITEGSQSDSKLKEGTEPLEETDALTLAQNEVDRLFDEHDLHAERENVHVVVARWKRKNGICKYNKVPKKNRYNKRIYSESVRDNHLIGVNERIFEEGNVDDFLDTIRHELAHVECYVEYGFSQGHNDNWVETAKKFGSTGNRCGKKKSTDYKYYVGCPDCGIAWGRVRMSKKVKYPHLYDCDKCGSMIVSYDAGKAMPYFGGTADIDELR